jgi:uncharacterized membrane protein YphA (DoxX/SURF4 family)
MDAFWTIADWAGRILFAIVFVNSGIFHLRGHKYATGYAKSKGVPLAGFAVAITGLQILVGALMIVPGWHPIIGALLLAVFLLPVAVVMHNFWTVTDPAQKANDQAHFFKDLALTGAALLYAVALHRQGVPW